MSFEFKLFYSIYFPQIAFVSVNPDRSSCQNSDHIISPKPFKLRYWWFPMMMCYFVVLVTARTCFAHFFNQYREDSSSNTACHIIHVFIFKYNRYQAQIIADNHYIFLTTFGRRGISKSVTWNKFLLMIPLWVWSSFFYTIWSLISVPNKIEYFELTLILSKSQTVLKIFINIL